MNKLIKGALILGVGAILAACGNQGTSQITIGSKGSDAQIWEYAAQTQTAKDLGLEIIVEDISQGPQLNQATADGQLDVNAFQTIDYFNQFNKDSSSQLAALATTYIEPMGIYSDKYQSLEEIPEGAKVAIQVSPSDASRGLKLLSQAGLIQLDPQADDIVSTDDIVNNPLNLKFSEIDENAVPVHLPDVDLGLIGNTIALEAGLNVLEDAIYYEQIDETTSGNINILVTAAGQENREDLQKLGELYHSEEVQTYIDDEFQGTKIQVNEPIENYLD